MKTIDSLIAEREDAENRADYAEGLLAEYEQVGTALKGYLDDSGTSQWLFVSEGSVDPGIPVFARRSDLRQNGHAPRAGDSS